MLWRQKNGELSVFCSYVFIYQKQSMRGALIILVVLVFGFVIPTNAWGQLSTANSTVQASIVRSVNILKVRDLNFGYLSSGATGGTVVLTPLEAATRSTTGGVLLQLGNASVNSAKFIVSGADGYSFSIILPVVPVILSNGINTMSIDNFASTPSGSGIFSTGSQPICIGARLNVGANQAAGVYSTTEDFAVTINYN